MQGEGAIIEERLIERDFGEFEGLTRNQFDFLGFWNLYSNLQYKKAETISDVEKRVFSFIEELKQIKDKNILLVSHGGVGCVFLSYFKGKPLSDGNYLSFEIPHGKPIVLDFDK